MLTNGRLLHRRPIFVASLARFAGRTLRDASLGLEPANYISLAWAKALRYTLTIRIAVPSLIHSADRAVGTN